MKFEQKQKIKLISIKDIMQIKMKIIKMKEILIIILLKLFYDVMIFLMIRFIKLLDYYNYKNFQKSFYLFMLYIILLMQIFFKIFIDG